MTIEFLFYLLMSLTQIAMLVMIIMILVLTKKQSKQLALTLLKEQFNRCSFFAQKKLQSYRLELFLFGQLVVAISVLNPTISFH